MPEKNQDAKGERRRSDRVKKNFILTYCSESDPEKRYEITQLKNISLGGMCFITTRSYTRGTKLSIELKTPYLSDTTHLDGKVLESHEKVKNMIYETRFQFGKLSPQAEFILARMIDFFISGGKKLYE